MKLLKSIGILFIVMFTFSFVSATLTDATAYWAMDSSTGELVDSSSNGNTLTNYGATATSSGKLNEAFSFDGSNDYIDGGSIDLGSSFSINLFIYKSTYDDVDTWIATTDYHNSDYWSIADYNSGDGILFRLLVDGNNYGVASTSVLSGGWHMLTLVVDDSSKKVYGYIDGVKVTENTFSGTYAQGSENILLGKTHSDVNYLNGVLDEFSIYGRSLSSSEISELYNSGAGHNPYSTTNTLIEFTNITANGIEDFDNESFETYEIEFNVSAKVTDTNENVTLQYKDTYTNTWNLICSDCLTGSIKIKYPDDLYGIYFRALNNETNITTDVYAFSIYNLSHISSNLPTGVLNNNKSYYIYTGDGRTVNMNITYNSLQNVLTTTSNYPIDLGNLQEGSNTIKVRFYNEIDYKERTYTFNYDTTPPTINIFNTSEINSYYINWSQHFNYSDTNIDTCQVTTQAMRTNCSEYEYWANGNQSVEIYVNDTAGNSNTESYTQLVNPYQYLYFRNNVTMVLLSDYYLNYNNIDFFNNVTEFKFKLFDLGYGNLSLDFYKWGFYNTTVDLELNTTSDYNLTTNIQPVPISIKMYDSVDSHQITFDVTILNSTDYEAYTSQTNFSKYYSDIPTGDVEVVVSATGYDDTTFFYTINPFTALSIVGYLTPSNISEIHTFYVQEATTDQYLKDVIVEVQKLIQGTYTTLVQKKTSESGAVYFDLDPSKEYKVIFTKAGYVSATAQTIPQVKSYTVKLAEEGTAFTYIDELSYSIKPTSTTLDTNTTYVFQGFISDNSFTQTSFNIKYGNGTVIYDTTSLNPSGTTFTFNYLLPADVNQTSLIVTLSYIKDGVTSDLVKTYTINTINKNSFITTFRDFGNKTDENSQLIIWFFLIMLVVSVLIWGSFIGSPQINLMIVPIILTFTYFGWIGWVNGAVVMFVAVVLYLGGQK